MNRLSPVISIRQKLTASFLLVSLLIAVIASSSVMKQIDTIERGALLEAKHLATLVTYTGVEDVLSKPKFLQENIDRMTKIYERDIVIVDIHKNGIADANVQEVNQIFSHDPENEVGKSIADGKVRTFVELNPLHSDGAKQIVVPLRKDPEKLNSPIIGAVISRP